MKKQAAKKTATPKKRSKEIRISLTDEEYARFKAKSATTRHGSTSEFARSVVLNASKGGEKTGGEPGNRTQPNESVPPAGYKSAAPPRRGRPASTSEKTPTATEGSHTVGYKSHPDSPVEYATKDVAKAMHDWRDKDPQSVMLIERFLDASIAFCTANPGASQAELSRRFPQLFWETFLPSLDESANDLYKALMWESDRGCVLVAASVIDESLKAMLCQFFKSRSAATKDDIDFFFDSRAMPPLQSTALKIRFAFACGLLDRDLSSALLALQSLRSKIAAHSRKELILTKKMTEEITKWIPESLPNYLANSNDAKVLRQMFQRLGAMSSQAFHLSDAKFEFAMAANFFDWLICQETKRLEGEKSQSMDGSSP